jgi:hypothetical protein
MTFLDMPSPPFSCYLVLLTPISSSPYSEAPLPMFLSQLDAPSFTHTQKKRAKFMCIVNFLFLVSQLEEKQF